MALFGKRVAPLHGTFMATSIVGFLVSAYMIEDISWKFTMLIFFAVMFIASFISMTKAPMPDKRFR
jgi:ABC-type multidrug transport system fused ATPase/permease subunit